MKNNNGFTLIEAMFAIVLMSMASLFFVQYTKYQSKQIVTLKNKLEQVISEAQGLTKGYKWIYVNSTCQKVVPGYWVKKQSSTVANFYITSSCASLYGTLDSLNNQTFADDVSNTLWTVSSSGSGLRVLVQTLR